jgi:protein gp37
MLEWTAHNSDLLSPNVWLGVSVETSMYISRIKHLQSIPAMIRFLSLEPLLGPIHFETSYLRGIQWMIVGGESGPRARPMKPEWARDIQQQCHLCQVPFFFKQWGTFNPEGERVGKKNAGRILDGKIYDEMPEMVAL